MMYHIKKSATFLYSRQYIWNSTRHPPAYLVSRRRCSRDVKYTFVNGKLQSKTGESVKAEEIKKLIEDENLEKGSVFARFIAGFQIPVNPGPGP